MSFQSTFHELMESYRRDHTHPVNKATHMVGIPMIVVSLPLLVLNPPLGLSLFVLGWVLQFIGHAFEGKKPSFFSDPRFLLIGVAYFVDKGRALLGLGSSPSVDEGQVRGN